MNDRLAGPSLLTACQPKPIEILVFVLLLRAAELRQEATNQDQPVRFSSHACRRYGRKGKVDCYARIVAEPVETDIASKVAKALEFYTAAQLLADSAYDATISLSASAAINATDALLLFTTGQFASGSDHGRAVSLLRQHVSTSASTQLSRVLGMKTKAQYSIRRCSLSEAESALRNAERLIQRCEAIK